MRFAIILLLVLAIQASADSLTSNQNCSKGFYYNQTDNHCGSCLEMNCTSCSENPEDLSKVICQQCPETMLLSQSNTSCHCKDGDYFIADTMMCVETCPTNYVVVGSSCIKGCDDPRSFKYFNGRCIPKNWIEKNWMAVAILGVIFSAFLCALVIFLRIRAELKQGEDSEKRPIVQGHSPMNSEHEQ